MPKKTMVLSAAALSVALGYWIVAPASASFGMACMPANPPMCVSGSLKDQWTFNNCRSEVESYVQNVDSYVRCLRNEEKAAIDESNETVRKFNCKAQGQTCF